MNNPYDVLGVPETASNAEVKKAYLNLARKYHPDNYHDSPLEDLAQEKMKEINAAYEEINKSRNGRGTSGNNYGYGNSGTAQQSWGSGQSYSSVLQQVRIAINMGDLSRAESLLASYQSHDAEWNFLKGVICYRRGWMDEAERYYQTACQMDPGNAEYRQALNYMENGAADSYHPDGTPFGTDACGNGICQKLCCAYLFCNGCGYWGFCR